jgi:hypothetical protein
MEELRALAMVMREMELKALARSIWRRMWLVFAGLLVRCRRIEFVRGGASLTPTPVWRGKR